MKVADIERDEVLIPEAQTVAEEFASTPTLSMRDCAVVTTARSLRSGVVLQQ